MIYKPGREDIAIPDLNTKKKLGTNSYVGHIAMVRTLDKENPQFKFQNRCVPIIFDDNNMVDVRSAEVCSTICYDRIKCIIINVRLSDGKNDQSIDLLKRALEKSPSAFIHHQLALCYKNKKIAEQSCRPSNKQKVQQWRCLCIHHLEEALKTKPLFIIALSDLALMYGEGPDFSRAEKLFQHGLEMLPEIPEKSFCQIFHHRYADFHFYHTKKEAEAIANYTEVLQIIPNTWEWRQSTKKLQKIADQRLSIDKDDSQAYALLAQVAMAKDNKKKAEEYYGKALDCDENNTEYLSVLCELRLNL